MNNEIRKLSPRAQELLLASNEERLAHIDKPVFIPYPRATELLNEMEDLLAYPKTNRMPNVLILGRSNNGKTELLREFLRRHPAEERAEFDTVYAPVIYVQAPPGPSEHLFLDKIMMLLGAVVKTNESPDKKLSRVLQLLSSVQNKVLLIDELNALLAGSVTKQRFFLNMLKYISNELRISIVAAGTAEAEQAVRSDAQIESRFPRRILPLWQEGDAFRKLLLSFEYVLPLKHASNLHKGELSRKLYGMCGGTIGELSGILKSAAKHAIQTGTEQITMDVIKDCSFVARKGKTNGEVI